jgi:hypothetical protein
MLAEAYTGLPGVRRVSTFGFGLRLIHGLFAHKDNDGVSYLFSELNEHCRMGCSRPRYWYFHSGNDGIEYVGYWVNHPDTLPPAWWEEADSILNLYRVENVRWEWDDQTPATPITDLLAGNPGSNDVILSWTAPYDSGYSGRVGRYRVIYSTSMVTEDTWGDLPFGQGPRPSPPGTQERFVLEALYPSTLYHFAVKSRDDAGLWSVLSNIATVSTTPAYGWTTFDSTNSGLPSNTVSVITADGNGGVWFGTSRGITHFDGSNWHAYTSANSAMTDDWITGIAIDASGNTWCVSYWGAHVSDGLDWSAYDWHDVGLPGTPFSMAVAPNGNIWIGSVRFGVAHWDGTDWTVDRMPVSEGMLGVCESIAFTPDGVGWFATYGVGVYSYDGTDWTTYLKGNSGIPANFTRSIATVQDGSVWFAHNSYSYGASRFDGTSWTQYGTGNTRYVMVDAADQVWFASTGATRYDGISFSTCTPTNSGLVSGKVLCIAEDAQGNMWFGTDKGVSRLAAEYIETYFGETDEEGL